MCTACIYTACPYTACIYTACIYTACIYTACPYTACPYTACIYTACLYTVCVPPVHIPPVHIPPVYVPPVCIPPAYSLSRPGIWRCQIKRCFKKLWRRERSTLLRSHCRAEVVSIAARGRSGISNLGGFVLHPFKLVLLLLGTWQMLV